MKLIRAETIADISGAAKMILHCCCMLHLTNKHVFEHSGGGAIAWLVAGLKVIERKQIRYALFE